MMGLVQEAGKAEGQYYVDMKIWVEEEEEYEFRAWLGQGEEKEPEDIAAMMLSLQSYGCHNINLVSPTHVLAPILAAVLIAAQAGLRLPLVWNTGGYDSLAALKLLDGVVDIYMPDVKYADEKNAHRYSKVKDYPAVNQAAVKAMRAAFEADERSVARAVERQGALR